MSESISNSNQQASTRSYSGVWVKAEEELPDEGEEVLVLTDEFWMGQGYVNDGEWQVVVPPWAVVGDREDLVVDYWTRYPARPQE
jgi:hypothetical protein